MVSITLALCVLSTQAETTTPKYNTKLDFHYVHQFESAIDNGGDVELTSYGSELRIDTKMTNSDDLQVRFQYQRDEWDFSGTSGLGLEDPWDTIDTIDLAFTWTHSYSKSSKIFLGGIARSSYEEDASSSTVYGGSIGFVHSFTSDFTLGLGVGVIEQILEDARLFPVFVLEWKLSENLRMTSDLSTRFGTRTGVELVWTPNSDWTLGAGISYSYSRFRLDFEDIAPNGAGETTAWPLSFRATYHASPSFDLTILGGSVFSGQLEITNQTRNVIERQEYESAGAVGVLAQIRF